jgi:hypothetical protein
VNSILSPAPGLEEAQPLVTQFEAREDEDRETFVTAEGLVQEVEEENAEVGRLLLFRNTGVVEVVHAAACMVKPFETVMRCIA